MAHKNREEKIKMFRIFQIDEKIRSGTFPNSVTLAEYLEVNSRTILRDIEYMRDYLNAPLEYDYNHKGFYYSEPNFYVKSIILTEGELFAVTLFDQLLKQYRNTPLEGSLKGIFSKIIKAMPENVSVDTAFIPSQTVFISDPPVSIKPEVFEIMFTALKTRQTVVIDYRPLEETEYSKRTLDSYHAVCQRNSWYILAHCHERPEGPRMYAFSRIKNPKLTGKHFNLPENYRVENYFDNEMGVFTTDKKTFQFEFLIDKEVGTYAMERTFHRTQKIEQLKDGSVHLSFETNQFNEVLRWVLGQGHTVKVINPPELIQKVKDEIERMKNFYD